MTWMAGRVAPYKKVRAASLVDAIPKSPSGEDPASGAQGIDLARPRLMLT